MCYTKLYKMCIRDRERAAVEVEISRFVHAVQLSGQIVLVVVALAAVGRCV